MSSPKKSIQTNQDMTMFGQLTQIQKQSSFINKQLTNDIQTIKKLQIQFTAIEQQAKRTTEQTRLKMNDEVKLFQDRIKNYLIAQKAEYMRFANQINQMIQNSREINAQLTVLGNKFEEFQKNVGI